MEETDGFVEMFKDGEDVLVEQIMEQVAASKGWRRLEDLDTPLGMEVLGTDEELVASSLFEILEERLQELGSQKFEELMAEVIKWNGHSEKQFEETVACIV